MAEANPGTNPFAVPSKFTALAAEIGEEVTTVVLGRMNEMMDERFAQFAQSQQVPTPPAAVPPPQPQNQNVHDWSVEAKHLRDFRKFNPHTFDGSLKDPTKVEMWLSSIETIFRYMRCPEEQKLQCAVFMLTDNAEIW